jgi:hypothetical protein
MAKGFSMRCPFPGMDPYLERREIWPDFQDSIITYIRETLQPLIRPKYVALTQDRLFVVESDRPVYPDVAVVETSSHGRESLATATLVADAPIVVEIARDEFREPFLQIIEPAAGNRVVTAIEVLSPDNKTPGPGRVSYVQKREEYWATGTNLVEIDLLRSGLPTVRISERKLTEATNDPRVVQPWRYLVAVGRAFPMRRELYPFGLKQRLPYINVPLGPDDADVVLNLQAAFERTWDAGPYPELLRYEAPPPGALSEDELALCRAAAARK